MKKKYRNNSFFKHKIMALLVLLVFTIHTKAQSNLNELNLTDAVNRVLENNPNLASSEAGLEASRSNIAIARGNALPALSFGGSVSQSKYATFSESSGVIPASSAVLGGTLTQMIYNEKYLANLKIQKYLFASEEEQYRSARYNTISATGIAYVGLLFADDLLQVQKENLEITKTNLQGARDRFEVGTTDKREVLRWETQMYADQQSVQSQKAVVIIRQGSLNQLFNVPLETKEALQKLSIEKDGFIFSSELVKNTVSDEKKARIIRDYLVELGVANSPVLASLDQQLMAQNRQVQSTKRWAIPSFSASVGADVKFDIENGNSEVPSEEKGFWKYGASMFWPILSGGSSINKVKQSKSQLSALELQIIDIKTSLEQAIRASAAVVISDFVNTGLANEQAAAAELNFELVNDAYLAGESSLLDLIDAQNQKLGADISSRVALYTFLSDLLATEQAIGYFPFLDSKENVDEIIKELELRLLEAK